MPDILTIGKRLQKNGFTQKQLTEKLWSMGVCASFNWVTAYCRSWSRDYGRAEIWIAIDKALEEMEAEKNGR